MKTSPIKRFALATLAGAMLLTGAACSNQQPQASSAAASQAGSQAASGSLKTVDKLSVYFVPSKDPQQIVTATAPLKSLLQKELVNEGYDVKDVEITVGTTYEAVGEALSSGTADVGMIPGGTYVLYDDGADVILTATRAGLSKDSDSPKDWNDGKATEATDKQVTYYRSLLIAGPTEKGKALVKKVNDGQKLTFEDLSNVNWSIMSSSSSAGYIYPALWLNKNFNKTLTDLPHLVQSDSYGSSFARLASGQVDVVLAYADARRDYEKKWTTDYGRKASIWEETGVIGVTDPIYNDTISVSKNSKIMDDSMKKALQTAFINIAKTDEGKKVIAIYSHEGYQVAKSSDYDNERKAQEILKQIKK